MQQDQDKGTTSRLISFLPPALQYPAFRVYWLALLASVSGYQMFRATQFWLIYQITESTLSLGYVGAAAAIPGILFNLFGGVFADKLDKRRLIMTTQATTASLICLLATLTLLDIVREWHVLAIAFMAGAVEAFDTPARQAIYPHLIDRKVMMSAVALNSAVWQGTRIVAPAIAGVIIALVGMETSFYVAGSGFYLMAAVMYWLRVPHIPQGARGSPTHEMLEGLKFIKANTLFAFLIGMTFFNSFFGMAYQVMMPEFAQKILGLGAGAYGSLLSASGAGALITTFWLGSRRDVRNRGLLIIGGATMFGLSVAAFALTSEFVGSYYLAMALMFTTGIFNSTYMISIQSSLQLMVPDHMRGRVMGFYGMTWSIMPLSGLQAGALASFIGTAFAVMAGGLAVAAFAIGPATINSKVRNLSAQLQQVDVAAAGPSQSPSHSVADS